jgi:hypothetical protein
MVLTKRWATRFEVVSRVGCDPRPGQIGLALAEYFERMVIFQDSRVEEPRWPEMPGTPRAFVCAPDLGERLSARQMWATVSD